MNDKKIRKLIEKIEEISIKYFDELSCNINGFSKKKLVFFMEKPGSSRRVNDWGRDEDTDYYIGVSENGWEEHITVMECGAGETVLLEEKTQSISNDQLLKILNESNLKNYLKFMNKCYDLTQKYSGDFGILLY
ncbi:hypothetical protein ACSW93_06415 [Clostridium perfringens]|uniref:hypothetical protein n=1 Tax=Clostridium perfringens TaxID=1502 RepID=UPI000D70DC8B|nr:hypothetical protein [Clostridium perfringens]PWX08369.1 hypothetical protein CYK70_07135 [Clostridium perfringens]